MDFITDSMTDYFHYVIILVLLIVGFYAFKKVASCLFKTIISIVVLAAMAFAWWYFHGF